MIPYRGLPYGESVTLVRRHVTDERDDYGMPLYEDVETEVPGCAVFTAGAAGQPFSQEIGASLVLTRLQLEMPSHVELDPDDRVRLRGIEYEVDGELGPRTSPFSGRRGPTQVFLKRATG